MIRFRNYRLKNDSEEYYRERLMLYVPWKRETEILGKFASYEEAFFAKYDEVKKKIGVYEPMSSVLELVEEELEKENHENEPVVAPSTQYENDMLGNVSSLDKLVINQVNTCLFYQACKVHDIVCFGD